MRAHWAMHGFGWYAFRDRETGALVARGGPHDAHVDGPRRSRSAGPWRAGRWGEGLATELGAASVDLAFGPLGLVDVVSFTLHDNVASRRVMEKLGFAFERDTSTRASPTCSTAGAPAEDLQRAVDVRAPSCRDGTRAAARRRGRPP